MGAPPEPRSHPASVPLAPVERDRDGFPTASTADYPERYILTIHKTPGTPTPQRERHSTAHVRVTTERAEILARQFPDFSVVEIRECLEGEPLKQAIGLLNWALEKEAATPDRTSPYRTLRFWARKNGKGFYSAALLKGDARETYRRYKLYLRRKEEEKLRRGGGSLLPSEIERLTRWFYAPESRARMASISEAVWNSYEAG